MYDAVFEALPCEIVVHDEYAVALANAAACRILDAPSPRSLIGLPLSAIVHPEELAAGERRRARLFGHGEAYRQVKLRLTTLSGKEFTFDATALGFTVGKLAYALVLGTLHCPDGATLAEENHSFSDGTPLAKAALDALPQPVSAYDSRDRIIYANPAAARFFGAHDGSLAGQSVSTLMHPHTEEAARQRRRLVLDHGQSFSRIEAKLRTLDGETLHAVGSLGRARTSDDARVGYWMGHAVERAV